MATAAEVASLRANTGQNTDEIYTDPDLVAILDAAGSVEAASAVVWRQLAAEYAKLVDTKEAGAEHRWGQLNERAMAMADFYDVKAAALSPSPSSGRPRMIPITRV